jgi:hypothetical protein
MRWLLPALSYGLIAIGVIAILGLMAWAARRGRPSPGPNDNSVIFCYNFVLRGFAFFAAFGIPTGVTILVFLFPPRGVEVWYVAGVYALFAALSLPLYWETSRFYVLITPEAIERRSPWFSYRSIAWEDIAEVSFSSVNAWFIFLSKNGEKIRVHTLITGLDDLLRLVELRIPAERLRKARVGYERVRRQFPHLPDQPILEARRPRG